MWLQAAERPGRRTIIDRPLAPHYFSPLLQILVGGATMLFRTGYDWPASIDTEAENRNCGGFAGDRLLHPCFNVP